MPQHHRDGLEEDFKQYLGVPVAKVTCSGTAAFYVILETLKTLSPKKTVIIPSYICPLVPLAIRRAELTVEICDITRNDFNFDYEELETLCASHRDVLAIVPTHLGGIPVEMARVAAIARSADAFVIEDCAQSLGAIYHGKKVGTLGDFAFFSLCRGKGLTIYEGGVLATARQEHEELLNRQLQRLEKTSMFAEGLKVFELFGYGVFYRPQLFWFAYRLPERFWDWSGDGLRAEREYFTANFPVHTVSRVRKALGHAMFARLDAEIERQRRTAAKYLETLDHAKGLSVIREPLGSRATYPKVTVFFEEPSMREEALASLRALGLGGSVLYTSAITDYDYLKPMLPNTQCPNGRYLAERVMTLSTSVFLTEEDLGVVVKILRTL